jgi:trimethylamine:corrinoid methyltransferase-like protein
MKNREDGSSNQNPSACEIFQETGGTMYVDGRRLRPFPEGIVAARLATDETKPFFT